MIPRGKDCMITRDKKGTSDVISQPFFCYTIFDVHLTVV